MTTVYNVSSQLAGTDDGGGDDNTTYRIVISSSVLSAAPGTTGTLTVLWGSSCPTFTGSPTTGCTSTYFGQAAASGNTYNFTGDQVQVKWSGNAYIASGGPGLAQTSDTFTLGETFDYTKNYVFAFDIGGNGAAHISINSSSSGTTFYYQSGAAQASVTAPTGTFTEATTTAYFIESITINATTPVTYHFLSLMGVGTSILLGIKLAGKVLGLARKMFSISRESYAVILK